MHFSNTQREAWLDCEAFGYAVYVERHRAAQASSMRLGSLTHACLAAHLRRYAESRGLPIDGETDPRKALRVICAAETWDQLPGMRSLEEDGELAYHLAERAIETLALHEHRFTPAIVNGVAAIEQRVYLPIDDPELAAVYDEGYLIVMDLLAHDAAYDGRLALIDHKITKYLGSTDLGLDVQLATYQHVLSQALGLWPEFAYQYRIKPVLPSRPEPLAKPVKGRKLSTARKGIITEASFLAACIEVGDDPHADYYASFREWLRTSRLGWTCSLGGASRADAAAIYAESLEVARRAARHLRDRDPSKIVRHLRTFAGSQCSRCALRSPCRGSTGGASFVDAARRFLEAPTADDLPVYDLEDLDLEA